MGDHSYVGLLEAAPPCSIIKAGSMMMRMGMFAGWKRFHFEARNKADNSDIYYYDGCSDVAGRISCFGYIIESLTEEEVQNYGAHCLKLVPSVEGDGTLQTFLLRCDSRASYKEWEVALSGACRRARPPVVAGRLAMAAFAKAVVSFRCMHGAVGGFRLSHDTPTAMLVQLLGGIVQRTQLTGTIERIRLSGSLSNETKEENISSILDTVQALVRVHADEQWTRCVAYADCQEGLLRAGVQQHRQIVDACIVKVRQSISHIFESPTINIEDTLGGLHMHLYDPLMEISAKKVTDAYLAAMDCFYVDMKKRCDQHVTSVNEDSQSLEIIIDAIRKKLDQTPAQMDYVKIAQKRLWHWYTDDLLDIAGQYSDESTPFEIYCDVLDDMVDMVRCAIHTLSEFLRNGGGGHNTLASLEKVIDRVTKDVYGRQRRVFTVILRQLSNATVQERLSMLWWHRAEHISGDVLADIDGEMDSGEVFSPSEMAGGMQIVTVRGVGERMIQEALHAHIDASISYVMGGGWEEYVDGEMRRIRANVAPRIPPQPD